MRRPSPRVHGIPATEVAGIFFCLPPVGPGRRATR